MTRWVKCWDTAKKESRYAQCNPCVKLLLSGYRQTFEVLKEGEKVKVQSHTRTGLYSKTVAPMLKSKWGQSIRLMLKQDMITAAVATAVAQMMYYHQWPARGQEKRICGNLLPGKKSADFSQVAVTTGPTCCPTTAIRFRLLLQR